MEKKKEPVMATWTLSESVALRDLTELTAGKRGGQNEGFFFSERFRVREDRRP